MKQLCSLFLYILPVVLFLLQNGCSPELAGATTETTNGVTGKLQNSDDSPAADIVVKLFPDDFDPLTDNESTPPVHDTTDGDGTFKFKDVAPGSYTVLALDSITATGFYTGDIDIVEDSMTTISDGTLTETGSVATDFSASADIHGSGYVYLPGTDLYSRIEDAGTALLSNVPVGLFSELILATDDGEKRNILSEAVTVTSHDTITIVNPLWKHHREIILNTSPTGADLSVDIPDFPVLIRLNENNFDFGQALPDGGDLLFTGNGDLPLAYEIEQWDSDAQHAAIWVRIDTIFGNNSAQTITMYWGNPDASSSSNGTAVFDTAAGYQGVWHLGGSDIHSAMDATFNSFNGTAPEGMQPQLSQGIIGNCRTFDGDDDYITMPNTADGNLNFPEDGAYTVCAWVYLESSDNESHCIVAKGYEQYFLRSTYIEEMTIVTEPLWEFVEFSEDDKWQILTNPASSEEWVFLAGVCQGDRQLLFCNGEMVDSSVFRWPNDQVVRNTSNDLYIGRFAEEVTLPPMGPKVVGYNHFKGSIDEVRIISRSQSPEWVRLCYMNQRPDDRLVQF